MGKALSGHVLNDQHRRFVRVLVSNADHAQGPMPEWDRVARSPVWDSARKRRRLSRHAVSRLEPDEDA